MGKKADAKAKLRSKRQQQTGGNGGGFPFKVVIGVLVAVAAVYGGYVMLDDDFGLVPLTPHSLPNNDKLQLAIRHEQFRKNLNLKKKTPKEVAAYEDGYKKNQFNQWISDKISLHRRAYDTRPMECLSEKYHSNRALPSTSVIIIFYNEARSTLLRTVWSVLDRSPKRLIKEILLVDDFSDMPHLGKPLDEDVASIPKTRIIRLGERSGLIRAKVMGAKQAKGDVILFLDSHCECNDGWLEPLLDRIKRNRKTVAMPIIDAIDYETWEHRTGLLERGVFDWSLTFNWNMLTDEDNERQGRQRDIDPFMSPAMAGGLFAMDRNYFFEVGAYDMGMETWGGENIEMSVRIWTCGGRIEAIPCSHVAHVFRKETPYKFKTDDPLITIAKNLNRVAEVWLDDKKDVYYSVTGNKQHGAGDVSERVEMRNYMGCKSFDWYMKNIFYDLNIPESYQTSVDDSLEDADGEQTE
eukprot:m.28971 g.28971  ORF g.28971 m.28971 type:complete len:466 (-) comp9526_c0_seq1:88-1485(-)